MSAKQRASIKGRTDDLLDPKRGLASHSPASASSAAGEKSRKPESAKVHLEKVGTQLDSDLHHALKTLAITRRRKFYELLNEAIAEYLDRQKGETR